MGGSVTTQTALRIASIAGRAVSPVVAAAIIGLSIYVWRSWLRGREEAQWEVDWAEFRRQELPRA